MKRGGCLWSQAELASGLVGEHVHLPENFGSCLVGVRRCRLDARQDHFLEPGLLGYFGQAGENVTPELGLGALQETGPLRQDEDTPWWPWEQLL